MKNRLELHEILCSLLGSRNVYFQPPESVKMSYPAIIYELDDINNSFADDVVYLSKKRYKVTVIDKNPDSLIVWKLAALTTSAFCGHYTSENLNHDIFTLYF